MQTEIMNNVQDERQKLLKKRASLITAFSKAAEAGKEKRLSDLFARIRQTNDFLEALAHIEGQAATSESRSPRYVISSLFLHEAFRMLTADQNEQFVFITGSEVGGVF